MNRRAAYATAAMAIAAEFPDIDTLWGLRGPVEGFAHHRGITHTFVGIPVEAGCLLLVFFLWHHRRWGRQPRTAAPVRWGVLYGLIVLALLSHILLDFTNNYGVRPFFPFNPHWFAASIVFIFDPLLFLFLLAGLLLPSLFGLIGREVGVRRERFAGRGWARAALAGVLLLWAARWMEHGRALALADAQTLRAPASGAPSLGAPSLGAPGTGAPDPSNLSMDPPEAGTANGASAPQRALLPPLRSLANPDPFSIFRWYTVTDFGPAYRLATANANGNTLLLGDVLTKPGGNSPVLRAAERSYLGRVYLDWSPMPFVTVSHGSETGSADGDTTIRFADPRFMGDAPLLRRGGTAPLTGTVQMNGAGDVVAESMDGRFERR